MDKVYIESTVINHEQEKYVLGMLWEEGTNSYSVELLGRTDTIFAADFLLIGQARELYDEIIENIGDYIE
jgi:hypothetical protein